MKVTTPIADIYPLFANALTQPHVLIAGKTRSGKSVFIDGMMHVIMTRLPGNGQGQAQVILIDPKGTELLRYKDLPHTIMYSDMTGDIIGAFRYGLQKTKERFAYNQQNRLRKYPGGDIWIIVDEFMFLRNTYKKEVTDIIQNIAALGAAAHVHMVIATQCPKATIIPTEITCNFDAIVGLKTSSTQDSRNIIGKQDNFPGLQTLPNPQTAGYGKCYYMTPDTPEYKRLKIVPFIHDDELDRLVDWWATQYTPPKHQHPARSAPVKRGLFGRWKTA